MTNFPARMRQVQTFRVVTLPAPDDPNRAQKLRNQQPLPPYCQAEEGCSAFSAALFAVKVNGGGFKALTLCSEHIIEAAEAGTVIDYSTEGQ